MSHKTKIQLPFDHDLEGYLRSKIAELGDYRVLSKSLDARGANKGKVPIYQYDIEYTLRGGEKLPHYEENFPQFKALKQKPIIIGAGPAGLFCALRLSEYGIPSLIIERGKAANKRMLSIAKFWRYGELDPDTNVCYGEGGAGLYSDGKLITRIKSPYISYVMQKFVDFGAPEETAYISNPHLGSNKIRDIIGRISALLVARGCEFSYETKVDSLLTEKSQVVGVKTHDGKSYYSDHVILATGHSARDMYKECLEKNIAMEAKDFSVGVRIEHSRQHIDHIQYGGWADSGELQSARYRLSHHDKESDRGTYSFCMCPGGYVLSSGTEKEGIVVNGMSNYARNSRWSNSALVVTIRKGKDFAKKGELWDGIDFQENIEKLAYKQSKKLATGRELPTLSLGEFFSRKISRENLKHKTSTPSGIVKAPLWEILPDFVYNSLEQSLNKFDQKLKGFKWENALIMAPETRTSSALTILRDKEKLTSISHPGLYPCGEGAGYAGGITSAAVDGIRVAMAILTQEFPVEIE